VHQDKSTLHIICILDENRWGNSHSGCDVKCNIMKFWVHKNSNSTLQAHEKRRNVELVWKFFRLAVKDFYMKKRDLIVGISVSKS